MRRILFAGIPIAVLVAWFGYLWWISGVIPAEEKYPNGKIKAQGLAKRVGLGEYRRHGQWTFFHEDGSKAAEGSYGLGEKTGTWTHWNQRGVKIGEEEFRDGVGTYRDIAPPEPPGDP